MRAACDRDFLHGTYPSLFPGIGERGAGHPDGPEAAAPTGAVAAP